MNGTQSANGDAQRYYGKYRGTVLNNVDPMRKGRIQVIVPDVNIAPSTWAMPCVPVAGLLMGALAVPPIQAGVWVEFEQGDPDYPIWVGGWWGSAAEIPPMAQPVQPPIDGFTWQTTLQNSLQITDLPGPTGGLFIKTTTGATITMNDTGLILNNGKGALISMVGSAINIIGSPVTVNAGALTVT